MAGFGTTLSELIEKDREYYRAKAEKRKDYLQTYGTKAVVDIEGKANDALAVANQLQNFGFSKEFVTGITAKSGVRGMYDFAQNVLKRTDLTPDDIKELETSAIDFVNSNPEEDLETVINRAYGLYKSESDPVKRKTGMLGAMLGLDARALEDQVINAEYYGGYSGQDLIRIAASSGPKAGKPLGIKLPPKPISPSDLNIVNRALSTQFSSSISRQMDELGVAMASTTLSAEARQTLTAKREKLEELVTIAKTNEGEAMARYISNPEYDGGDFLTYLQGIEANRAGSISNNFLLGDYFKTTYSALTAGEDVPVRAAGGQGNGKGTPPVGTPTVYTPTELRASLAANKIEVGSKVEVNGNVVTVTQTQIDKAKVETGKDLSTSTEDEAALQRREAALNDLDLSVPTPGLTDDDMGLPDGPVPKSLIPAIQSGNKTAEWISASSEDLNTSVTSNAFRLASAVDSGLATAIDFLTGIVGGTEETGVSKSLKSASKYQLEQAAEVAAKGFTEYWTSDLEDGDGFKPEFPGDVPEGVVKEVKGSYLDAIMDMLGMGESSETRMVNGTPMTDAEILAAARAQLDAEVLKRVEEAHRAKVLRQQAMNEGVRVLPESPGDVPDNLEDATTESISKSLRFLTELPERIHQSLFDTQDKINASIAALFEETLEERIMKNEGQRNRVVALQALKDKISDLRKEAEVEQTVEPEPLVTRPKKPLKPKGMTASDKARLQRAQKANELSGDSGLLEMLVKKYGIALVQKEMGL
jgi:hypothetical protein